MIFPLESAIFSDLMVVLGGKNAFLTESYRFVEVNDSQGNPFMLITNHFDLSSEKISQMYRARGQIAVLQIPEATDHYRKNFHLR